MCLHIFLLPGDTGQHILPVSTGRWIKATEMRCLRPGKMKVSIKALHIINSFLQQMLTEQQLYSRPCAGSMGDTDGWEAVCGPSIGA